MLASEYPLAVIGSCIAVCINPVRQILEGSNPNGGNQQYAVYVIYDRRSLVADYVVAQAEALARIGYRVVIVSTSPQPTELAGEQTHTLLLEDYPSP